jgi:deoxyribonuclease-1
MRGVKSFSLSLLVLSATLVCITSASRTEARMPQKGLGNQQISDFRQAKKFALRIHQDHPFTIYCNCRYSGKKIDLASCGYEPLNDPKRAGRLEWEHVVPAEAFGQSFPEWRGGSPQCRKHGRSYRGRKCAEKNHEFARMEGDLYNLWPEVGELNGLRANYSMAELGAESGASSGTGPVAEKSPPGQFGRCRAKIEDRKFEPMPQAKGRVARTYFYMEMNYPGRGIISDKNRKLFEAWDKQHPPDAWECERARRIEKIQGNPNAVLQAKCKF